MLYTIPKENIRVYGLNLYNPYPKPQIDKKVIQFSKRLKLYSSCESSNIPTAPCSSPFNFSTCNNNSLLSLSSLSIWAMFVCVVLSTVSISCSICRAKEKLNFLFCPMHLVLLKVFWYRLKYQDTFSRMEMLQSFL